MQENCSNNFATTETKDSNLSRINKHLLVYIWIEFIYFLVN
jgi:hypothetical protein